VAAAAGGSMTLLILGLAISIPLVVFGAKLLVTLMERFPVIITIGAALIGMVAGEMLVTDPVALDWMQGLAGMQIEGGKPKLHGVNLELAAGAVGAVIVVVWGLWLAKRQEAAKPAGTEEKTETGNS
jgi:predicted tellurium resistance membrane protein TerC